MNVTVGSVAIETLSKMLACLSRRDEEVSRTHPSIEMSFRFPPKY